MPAGTMNCMAKHLGQKNRIVGAGCHAHRILGGHGGHSAYSLANDHRDRISFHQQVTAIPHTPMATQNAVAMAPGD
jgi:hypothetical protein